MPGRALVLLLVLATTAVADEGWDAKGWSCRAPDGCERAACCRRAVATWSRPAPGTKLRAVRAVGDFDASPAAVAAVITDYGHLAEFLPHIEASRIVARDGDDAIVWELADFSLARRRDWVVRFHVETRGDVVHIAWRTETGPLAPPPDGSVIRMPRNDGTWLLEPLDGGRRARVTYEAVADVGGWIPRWLADRGTVDAMPAVFDALASRLAAAAAVVKR